MKMHVGVLHALALRYSRFIAREISPGTHLGRVMGGTQRRSGRGDNHIQSVYSVLSFLEL
jgi:hypothetical protein